MINSGQEFVQRVLLRAATHKASFGGMLVEVTEMSLMREYCTKFACLSRQSGEKP